ncbi:hypothetical protein BCR34DRAFT_599532 [Clohesyomyces aquaticus]|uniref:Uncharacterized protein n=1 Tax=Clohesyomyces aquaticus TaxID=1231657 RepID=A0A1Y1ZUN0_9PLEO|nr:hypothetical protein BCR34DRAFT_599532 [Clohesyomyces aquaticus]
MIIFDALSCHIANHAVLGDFEFKKSAELLPQWQRFIPEHALKSFKDASAAEEPLDMKYSCLLNIADVPKKTTPAF